MNTTDQQPKPQTLEDIWNARDAPQLVPGRLSLNGEMYSKQLFVAGRMGDLRQLGDRFAILNLLRPGQITRVVTPGPRGINVEFPFDGFTYLFPDDTIVYYEPWFMDRGSYMVFVDAADSPTGEDAWVKFATELDPVGDPPE